MVQRLLVNAQLPNDLRHSRLAIVLPQCGRDLLCLLGCWPREHGEAGKSSIADEGYDDVDFSQQCPTADRIYNDVLRLASELLSNVVDGIGLGGGLLGFDTVDESGSLDHVG